MRANPPSGHLCHADYMSNVNLDILMVELYYGSVCGFVWSYCSFDVWVQILVVVNVFLSIYICHSHCCT
ncbi:hypothetical protein K439DRAFT_404124 [Ramaria rubella]|nr:hypothetical protein K439DRAFT_404124 [Ramaria rubella]